MRSFTRRHPANSATEIPGTIASTSTPLRLLPTGLPSLDDLLGGGLPSGDSLLILAPDIHSSWDRLMERHWIAQGLVSGQRSLIVGDADEIEDVVRGCPWVEEADGGSESEGEGVMPEGRSRIAWRYDRMKKLQSSVGSSNISLLKTIPPDLLDHLKSSKQHLGIPLQTHFPETSSLRSTLERLRHVIDELPPSTALRITIHHFGSPDWGDLRPSDIHRFLHAIRCLIRSRPVSALITMTQSLAYTTSLSHFVDASLTLRGFADDPTLSDTYDRSHGLLELHTFPSTHAVIPPTLKHSALLGLAPGEGAGGGAGENNLGFRLKRRKFVIETVHLGVEGGVGERQTGPVAEQLSLTAPRPEKAVESMSADVVVPDTVASAKPRRPARVRFREQVGIDEPEASAGGGAAVLSSEKPRVRFQHEQPELYDF